MKKERKKPRSRFFFVACLMAVPLATYAGTPHVAAQPPAATSPATQSSAHETARTCELSKLGSPYIPDDSWMYPAMLRLYSLGYVDEAYIGLRPWTRASVIHMLENADGPIEAGEGNGDPAASEARAIYDALNRQLHQDMQGPCGPHKGSTTIESVYSLARAMS